MRFVALLLVLAGCAAAPPASDTTGPQARAVVLVSIDGFRPDYLDRADVVAPTLRQLASSGVRAEMVPVYPTKTFPNHYTLVTGLTPARHGIVGNTIYDPERRGADGRMARFALSDRDAVTDARWWGGEPIWVTAERQGVRAGTTSWPGSEAAIGGVRPTRWLVYDGDLPYAARVDSVLAWLAAPEPVGLATLYFEGVDNAGHRYGPAAPEVAPAIADVDAALARLVDGLRRLGVAADLVIVSDHGMAPVDPSRRVVLDEAVDLDVEAEAVVYGEAAGLWPAEGVDASDLAARIDALPNVRAYRREDTPARFRYRDNPRIPPVVIVPDEGWSVTSQGYVDRYPERPSGGAHGFDHELASMRALFVAAGPHVRADARLDELSSLDVYEVLARLLGVTPAPNEGDATVADRIVRMR